MVNSHEDGISVYPSRLPIVANAIRHDNREFVEVALKLKFHSLNQAVISSREGLLYGRACLGGLTLPAWHGQQNLA